MPTPLALCLEDLKGPASTRYLRCVALPGNETGLTLDSQGTLHWKSQAIGVELWVSGDDHLMLFRPKGAPEVRVHRGGRVLQAPEEKPVVLRDQDELELGTKRLRVHVHGEATTSHEPEYYVPPRSKRKVAQIAAAVVLGASAACNSIQVRDHPPKVSAEPSKPAVESPEAGAPPAEEAGAPDAQESSPDATPDVEQTPQAEPPDAGEPDSPLRPPRVNPPPIEVRPHPPKPAGPRR